MSWRFDSASSKHTRAELKQFIISLRYKTTSKNWFGERNDLTASNGERLVSFILEYKLQAHLSRYLKSHNQCVLEGGLIFGLSYGPPALALIGNGIDRLRKQYFNSVFQKYAEIPILSFNQTRERSSQILSAPKCETSPCKILFAVVSTETTVMGALTSVRWIWMRHSNSKLTVCKCCLPKQASKK